MKKEPKYFQGQILYWEEGKSEVILIDRYDFKANHRISWNVKVYPETDGEIYAVAEDHLKERP